MGSREEATGDLPTAEEETWGLGHLTGSPHLALPFIRRAPKPFCRISGVLLVTAVSLFLLYRWVSAHGYKMNEGWSHGSDPGGLILPTHCLGIEHWLQVVKSIQKETQPFIGNL